MTTRTRSTGRRAGRDPSLPDGDLRDPEYRTRYIFGDGLVPKADDSRLANFLLFGALLRR